MIHVWRGDRGAHESAMIVDRFFPREPVHELEWHGGIERAPQELGLLVDVAGVQTSGPPRRAALA
jgi:hypothetical protein